VFDPIEVRRVWDEHVRGYSNNTATLWPVLMFDGWMSETHGDTGGTEAGTTTVAERLSHDTDAASR
jgi:hypothetical protein